MAKIAKDNKETVKWAAMFDGEEMVDLYIPEDTQNPANYIWMMINGQDIYLATEKELKVPKSVAAAYHYSYKETQKAIKRMKENTEIQA